MAGSGPGEKVPRVYSLHYDKRRWRHANLVVEQVGYWMFPRSWDTSEYTRPRDADDSWKPSDGAVSRKLSVRCRIHDGLCEGELQTVAQDIVSGKRLEITPLMWRSGQTRDVFVEYLNPGDDAPPEVVEMDEADILFSVASFERWLRSVEVSKRDRDYPRRKGPPQRQLAVCHTMLVFADDDEVPEQPTPKPSAVRPKRSAKKSAKAVIREIWQAQGCPKSTARFIEALVEDGAVRDDRGGKEVLVGIPGCGGSRVRVETINRYLRDLRGESASTTTSATMSRSTT